MPVRKSEAVWHGTLKEGGGRMRLASGLYEGPYTFSSRFEEAAGTNPEELVGAALAGCFSMFLASLLGDSGHPAESIKTTAAVHLGAGPTIIEDRDWNAKRRSRGWTSRSSRNSLPRLRRSARCRRPWPPCPR